MTQQSTNRKGTSTQKDWPGWWVQSGRVQASLCPVAVLCWELWGWPSAALPDLPYHLGRVLAGYCTCHLMKALLCIFQLCIFDLQRLGAQLWAPKLPDAMRNPNTPMTETNPSCRRGCH